MVTLNFPSVSQQNIVQILKKCHDESFIRLIQTCRRIYDVSQQMTKKSRIFCHAHLVAFVYFDEQEGAIRFDVPYRLKKDREHQEIIRDISCTHLLTEEMDDEDDGEVEIETSPDSSGTLGDEDSEGYDCKIKEEEEYVLSDLHNISHLMLRRSDRDSAHYRKMTADDLCRLLEFFRFQIITIDPNRAEFGAPHPKRLIVIEEILKIIPFIRAETLKLDSLESEDLFYSVLNSAYQSFNFRGLLIHNSDEYAVIEKLNFDWNSLENVEAQCLDVNAKNLYEGVIQRWTHGETHLKHLKLEIIDAVHFPNGLRNIHKFTKISNYSHSIDYFYIRAHTAHGSRYALIYWVYNIVNFFDISDCQGCNCQMAFCFKKMLEVVTDNFDMKEAVDWGIIVEDWESGTMEDLGAVLRRKLSTSASF